MLDEEGQERKYILMEVVIINNVAKSDLQNVEAFYSAGINGSFTYKYVGSNPGEYCRTSFVELIFLPRE